MGEESVDGRGKGHVFPICLVIMDTSVLDITCTRTLGMDKHPIKSREDEETWVCPLPHVAQFEQNFLLCVLSRKVSHSSLVTFLLLQHLYYYSQSFQTIFALYILINHIDFLSTQEISCKFTFERWLGVQVIWDSLVSVFFAVFLLDFYIQGFPSKQ